MIGGKVGGLAVFLIQLRHNENKLKAAAQRRAEEEAERVVEEMKGRVPADSGEARESIRIEAKPGGGVRVLAGGEDTTKDGYDYVRAIEFGRPPSRSGPGQPPRPFFRSAVDESRAHGGARMGDGIADDMKD